MVEDILVLADDLTGALEAGAAFAQHGIPVAVTFGDRWGGGSPVLVIDTETRHLSPEGAAARITELAGAHPRRLVYKKTDSTLRGQIRAELSALSELGQIIYVPAHPRVGRTIHDGCLYVDGVPLHETAFVGDPLNPVGHGNVAQLLLGESRVVISEANTHEEIREVARTWIARGGFAAGPSGFLQAAAELMQSADACPAPDFPPIGCAAVIVGSLHERSREQAARAAALFGENGWRLILSPEFNGRDPLGFSRDFAHRVLYEIQSSAVDTLIVFGGDTAYGLIEALGVTSIKPLGDVLPGVPVSQLPSGMTLITKAGGFGPPEILLQLHRKLAYVRT